MSYMYVFTNPSARAGCDTRSIFKRSLTGLMSDLSLSWTAYLTKAGEPSLPDHLPIADGWLRGLIPFPRILVLFEMQSASLRNWTQVTVSIFYNDNRYTTGTSSYGIYVCTCVHGFQKTILGLFGILKCPQETPKINKQLISLFSKHGAVILNWLKKSVSAIRTSCIPVEKLTLCHIQLAVEVVGKCI